MRFVYPLVFYSIAAILLVLTVFGIVVMRLFFETSNLFDSVIFSIKKNL